MHFNRSRSSVSILIVRRNPPAMQETPVWFLGQEDPLEKGEDTNSSVLGLPWSLAGKEFPWNAGDLGSIPELDRAPGEGKGYPLQYSGLDNSMDCIVQFSSVDSLSHVQLCDSIHCSTPALPVHHQHPEFTQTHVHPVGDAI